jgi:hypothetical protein
LIRSKGTWDILLAKTIFRESLFRGTEGYLCAAPEEKENPWASAVET